MGQAHWNVAIRTATIAGGPGLVPHRGPDRRRLGSRAGMGRDDREGIALEDGARVMLPPRLYEWPTRASAIPWRSAPHSGAAGVQVIQLRAKGAPRARVLGWAKALRPGAAPVVLIANGDPTIARDAGFDGVHLGRRRSLVGDARAIVGPRILIGAARGRSKRCAGTSTPTTSDSDQSSRRRRDTDRPSRAGSRLPGRGRALVGTTHRGVGGIGPGNVSAVQATGVHGWAVISALSGAGDLGDTVEKMSLRGTWTASRTLK